MRISTHCLFAIAIAAATRLVSGKLAFPAETPCEYLPKGFCHNRDEESVRDWNEQQLAKKHGNNLRGLGNVAGPPDYTPFTPAEYESVEGILLAFDGNDAGSRTYDLDVVAGIAAAVTNQPTLTKVFMVSNSYQEQEWRDEFISAGVDMDRVEWIEEDVDSVWIRDYGPRFICDTTTSERAAVDTLYYRYTSRPNDDRLPVEISEDDRFDHDNFDLSAVMHSGGNGHYFSNNRKAFATRLLTSDWDNAALTEEELKQYWQDYKGADLHFFQKLSFDVDGTGHIDMWFLPVSDNEVIIGQFEQEDSYGSKAILDNAADYMTSNGYTVYRTPNWVATTGWYNRATHYTYTNAVIANDVVVISKFNVEPEDTTALDVFQQAFPGKSIVQVDSSSIIERNGALHCISQHVFECGAESIPSTSTPPPTTASESPVTTTSTTTPTTTSEPPTATASESTPPPATTSEPPPTTTSTTPPCTDASTCPTPSSSCQVAVCNAGACDTEPFCTSATETCYEQINACSESVDCNYPGCVSYFSVIDICSGYNNFFTCFVGILSDGCTWSNGQCTGPTASVSICTGTPDQGPVCVV